MISAERESADYVLEAYLHKNAQSRLGLRADESPIEENSGLYGAVDYMLMEPWQLEVVRSNIIKYANNAGSKSHEQRFTRELEAVGYAINSVHSFMQYAERTVVELMENHNTGKYSRLTNVFIRETLTNFAGLNPDDGIDVVRQKFADHIAAYQEQNEPNEGITNAQFRDKLRALLANDRQALEAIFVSNIASHTLESAGVQSFDSSTIFLEAFPFILSMYTNLETKHRHLTDRLVEEHLLDRYTMEIVTKLQANLFTDVNFNQLDSLLRDSVASDITGLTDSKQAVREVQQNPTMIYKFLTENPHARLAIKMLREAEISLGNQLSDDPFRVFTALFSSITFIQVNNPLEVVNRFITDTIKQDQTL